MTSHVTERMFAWTRWIVKVMVSILRTRYIFSCMICANVQCGWWSLSLDKFGANYGCLFHQSMLHLPMKLITCRLKWLWTCHESLKDCEIWLLISQHRIRASRNFIIHNHQIDWSCGCRFLSDRRCINACYSINSQHRCDWSYS